MISFDRLDECLGRLLQRHVAVPIGARREPGGERHTREDQDQASPGGGRLHAFLAAGGGDHLGRRGLAGGDGRGERIASGQGGGHGGDRTGRAFGSFSRQRRITRSTAGSKPGVTVEGAVGVLLGVLAPPTRRASPLEGLASGEQLVEHEAERSRCRSARTRPCPRAARAPCRPACPRPPRRPCRPPRRPRGRSP